MTPITLSGHTIDFSDGVMERDARLLVAGAYPDKNLTVTEADMDALVTNFSGPVPVKVEHIDSPLDPLGLVTRVWRAGSELLGRVTFPPEMAKFLVRRDAHKLSVGLLKEPVWRLLEASLTLTPHVPTATLLSGTGMPCHARTDLTLTPADLTLAASGLSLPCQGRGEEKPGRDEESQGREESQNKPLRLHPPWTGEGLPSPTAGEPTGVLLSDTEHVELARLRAQVRKQTVDAQIVELKAAGRVIPATEALVRALLSTEESAARVTLSSGGPAQSVSAVALALLRAQPPLVRLSELAGGTQVQLSVIPALAAGVGMLDDDEREFTDEEREMMRRMGVQPDAVKKTMRADRLANKNLAKGQ